MANHRWTEEEENFLRRAADEYCTMQELAEAFNARFERKRSEEAIYTRFWKHLKLKLANTRNKPVTEEEMNFIVENAETMTHRELRDGIYALTGRFFHEITIARLSSEVAGIKHGQLTKKAYGYELVTKDGTILVKIGSDSQGGGSNFITKQRFMYEQYHGVKLDDSVNIIFLNGDNRDFSKENLYALPRRFVPIMAQNKWYFDDREMTLTAIKWCELFYAIKDLSE